ncbi:nickel-responsive transcriptional regulator NikR [Collinsella tanakaei]|nr:nickel-responsive transcriptional regulator NikR [Collinsella tanakaei]MBM6777816.1 nickel-responsive transcriptional regulator NikR [Collinsella tanakaei]MBM6785754.1 nickel-responsive transcriptional regulator NikR [Collinsella tanakaei]MCF6414042.1 nickel-responsive transcriptional regulator NikR [Collinsella tanakaei]
MLAGFDALIARRGDARNRSEAIRDLMRAALVRENLRTPDEQVIGSLTMIYDHHTGDLTRRLDEVQHDYTDEIVSTMHVHLDHHNCLEILALRGKGARVYELADKLLGLRGVHHGELTCAATGASLDLNA